MGALEGGTEKSPLAIDGVAVEDQNHKKWWHGRPGETQNDRKRHDVCLVGTLGLGMMDSKSLHPLLMAWWCAGGR